MKITGFTGWEEARAQSDAFPYVLVRELSRVWLGERAKARINWEDATELRFFSETGELCLFERAGERRAALIEDENEDNSTHLDRVFQLDHAQKYGTLLTVREYFGYDEDGQLCIAATRLKGWVK